MARVDRFTRLLMYALCFAALGAHAQPTPSSGGKDTSPPLVLWDRFLGECELSRNAIDKCYYIDPRIEEFRHYRGDRINFALALGQYVSVTRVQPPGEPTPGGLCWLGQMPGGGSASFAISRSGGFAGEIRTVVGSRYRVRFDPRKGAYLLEQLNPQAFNVLSKLSREQPLRSGGPVQACQNDTSWDVFFVYTTAVRNEVGTQAQVEALTQLAVCETNWAYDYSGVKFHIRSVGVNYVDYGDDTATPDIQRYRIMNYQGGLADVAKWRDQLGADFGVLLVENYGLGGNAPQLRSNYTAAMFAPWAYAVIDRFQLTGPGGYMLAHELGHMMGGGHNGSTTGFFPYSHAHLHPAASPAYAGGWRTVMGEYDPNTCTGVCERILAFSTSDTSMTWDGDVLGGALEDNVLTLNNTMNISANYRCKKVP